MKYRIVYAFQVGYHIQQSRLGICWRYSLYINDGALIFEDNMDAAILSLQALKNRGKPVKVMFNI